MDAWIEQTTPIAGSVEVHEVQVFDGEDTLVNVTMQADVRLAGDMHPLAAQAALAAGDVRITSSDPTSPVVDMTLTRSVVLETEVAVLGNSAAETADLQEVVSRDWVGSRPVAGTAAISLARPSRQHRRCCS